ncbi:MAG: hypothetical protein COW44_15310 [Flavobacteriaceae bacterium CG17_big_fil_post_rev_8_21_14_2_50_33_15]|nr:MAG: hypothetical protein COW44_15310 [Flavobacteriaceae bacterium CG17_big_fil_post_rev_8_21_14_2_50_33_15]
MGSLDKELQQTSMSRLGENKWQTHVDTVNSYWDIIEAYIEKKVQDAKGIKVYQDGIFVDGDPAMKIIQEGIKSGSKNSELVLKLIRKGAILTRTEDFKMVKDEYDGLQWILKSKNNLTKLFYLLRFKIFKPFNLNKRDRYIARRIAETLGENETGIVFIGAYHQVNKRLPEDINVIELKQVTKIRRYQKMLRSNANIKTEKFESLVNYLCE